MGEANETAFDTPKRLEGYQSLVCEFLSCRHVYPPWHVAADMNTQTLFSTLCLSMAFFSCLFWLSFFMQDMQSLNPLEVGVRLLPQAITGLILSPVIGCWMHRVNNALILAAAAVLQAGASILVLFLRNDSNYFAFIFPSLVLSTLSMDWVRNVGAVSYPDYSTVFVFKFEVIY